MHIEFKLPTGAGGAAAQHRAYTLSKQIKDWANQHNTHVDYNTGPAYRLCFTFAREQDYTLFALSWTINSSYDNYIVVQ